MTEELNFNQKCTKCGERPSNHRIHRHWITPPDQYLCCKCYVEGGSIPADWHPLCMKTAKKMKDKTK